MNLGFIYFVLYAGSGYDTRKEHSSTDGFTFGG